MSKRLTAIIIAVSVVIIISITAIIIGLKPSENQGYDDLNVNQDDGSDIVYDLETGEIISGNEKEETEFNQDSPDSDVEESSSSSGSTSTNDTSSTSGKQENNGGIIVEEPGNSSNSSTSGGTNLSESSSGGTTSTGNSTVAYSNPEAMQGFKPWR